MRYITILLAVLLLTACSETTQILMTSPSENGTTGTVPTDPTLVVEVRLAPSFLKIKNGDEVRVAVTTYMAGGIEIIAPFSPSIDGEQIVQILAATPSSTAAREVIIRARAVGECTLVVRSGDARAQASISVAPASP